MLGEGRRRRLLHATAARARTCRADLRASLHAAVERVLQQQGVHVGRQAHLRQAQDDIRVATAGVVGVRPIDWQNRPTFQQVVEFTGHRPRS